MAGKKQTTRATAQTAATTYRYDIELGEKENALFWELAGLMGLTGKRIKRTLGGTVFVKGIRQAIRELKRQQEQDGR